MLLSGGRSITVAWRISIAVSPGAGGNASSVDQVGDLDPVAGREAQAAEQVGAGGRLAGQRPVEAGEVGA
jgi:hypothetical protein